MLLWGKLAQGLAHLRNSVIAVIFKSLASLPPFQELGTARVNPTFLLHHCHQGPDQVPNSGLKARTFRLWQGTWVRLWGVISENHSDYLALTYAHITYWGTDHWFIPCY